MDELAVLVWVVDGLLKVLPTAAPPPDPAQVLRLSAAGGEVEGAQLAVRSATAVTALTADAGELRAEGGATIAADSIRCRFVGCIPVPKNTPGTPADELVAAAPCEIPDVLLEDSTVAVPADRTQSIVVTVRVPPGTAPGLYRGTVTVHADRRSIEVPVELTVYGFDVPAERHIYATNWYSAGNLVKAHNVEWWSDEFYAMMGRYARNMAEHRQNVFWLPTGYIQVTRRADGTLVYDYTRFDRYIQTFFDNGVDGRIELQPVAHHGEGGWSSTDILLGDLTVTDEATGKQVSLGPEEGLAPLLEALQQHLEEKGWLDRTMIHITDEPALQNIEAYRRASAFVHQHAPRLKRVEAIETIDFDGALEVWVPKLSHLRNWYDRFAEAQRAGNEMWFYICVHPTGRWMNRFLDYPLLKVRLLHWLAWRYQLDGYLHWGWNHWQGDPFGPPSDRLPPGDTHTIYPGRDGPLDSLRWEAERDSREDYEYLWLLSRREEAALAALGNPDRFGPHDRADAWCRSLVRGFLDFEHDPARFAAARDGLAQEIEQAAAEPLLVWRTYPPENVQLEPGPIVVELRGITRPGATVTVNGAAVAVGDNGRFVARVGPSAARPDVTVAVDHGGRHKEQTRHFAVWTGA